MVKVSIIMPVYNSQNYLRRAVDSIMEQAFEDFELIMINDGSSDKSGDICDAYKERYSNIRVVHKENGGICSARNAGLKIARGEYVGFCDNDDKFLPCLLKDNYVLAKCNNVDLMRYSKIKRVEREDGRIWETQSLLQDMFINKDEFYKHYQNIRREDTVWTALYRREVIEKYNIRFDERIKYGTEDLNFNLRFLMHCQRIGFNSNPYYLWTQRDARSTSRHFHKEFLEQNLINMDLEYCFYSEICKEKVDSTMMNIFLVNTYLYPSIEYMSIKSCSMSLNDKEQYLDCMRHHPLFVRNIDHATLKSAREKSFRAYVFMKLFYARKYKLLIKLFAGAILVLSKFRYKKVEDLAEK